MAAASPFGQAHPCDGFLTLRARSAARIARGVMWSSCASVVAVMCAPRFTLFLSRFCFCSGVSGFFCGSVQSSSMLHLRESGVRRGATARNCGSMSYQLLSPAVCVAAGARHAKGLEEHRTHKRLQQRVRSREGATSQ